MFSSTTRRGFHKLSSPLHIRSNPLNNTSSRPPRTDVQRPSPLELNPQQTRTCSIRTQLPSQQAAPIPQQKRWEKLPVPWEWIGVARSGQTCYLHRPKLSRRRPTNRLFSRDIRLKKSKKDKQTHQISARRNHGALQLPSQVMGAAELLLRREVPQSMPAEATTTIMADSCDQKYWTSSQRRGRWIR